MLGPHKISLWTLATVACAAFQSMGATTSTTPLTCEVHKDACIEASTPELTLGDTSAGRKLEGDFEIHVHGNTHATLAMAFNGGHCLRGGTSDPVIAYNLSITQAPNQIITQIPSMTHFDSGNVFGTVTQPVDGRIHFHIALNKSHFEKATPQANYGATITFTITEGKPT